MTPLRGCVYLFLGKKLCRDICPVALLNVVLVVCLVLWKDAHSAHPFEHLDHDGIVSASIELYRVSTADKVCNEVNHDFPIQQVAQSRLELNSKLDHKRHRCVSVKARRGAKNLTLGE